MNINYQEMFDFFFYTAFLLSKGVSYANKVLEVYAEEYSKYDYNEEYLIRIIADKEFAKTVGKNFQKVITELQNVEIDEEKRIVLSNFEKTINQIESDIENKVFTN